jgi:hypothetical protein
MQAPESTRWTIIRATAGSPPDREPFVVEREAGLTIICNRAGWRGHEKARPNPLAGLDRLAPLSTSPLPET